MNIWVQTQWTKAKSNKLVTIIGEEVIKQTNFAVGDRLYKIVEKQRKTLQIVLNQVG